MLILRIVAQNGEIETTELYHEFMLVKMRTKRQIRNYLYLLEAKGLIRMEPVSEAPTAAKKIQLRMEGLNGICQDEQYQRASAPKQLSNG
jgi:hypothetical protein